MCCDVTKELNYDFKIISMIKKKHDTYHYVSDDDDDEDDNA